MCEEGRLTGFREGEEDSTVMQGDLTFEGELLEGVYRLCVFSVSVTSRMCLGGMHMSTDYRSTFTEVNMGPFFHLGTLSSEHKNVKRNCR